MEQPTACNCGRVVEFDEMNPCEGECHKLYCDKCVKRPWEYCPNCKERRKPIKK